MVSIVRVTKAGVGVVYALMFATALASAQTPSVRADQDVYGRNGWILENGRVRVAIVERGGDIAEIRLIAKDPRLAINPMFIPAGRGYMGHMVCFPNFGPASSDERENGIGGHGEANAVEWRETRAPQVDAQGLRFFYGAELPKTQFRIERAVSMKTGDAQVVVEQWIENLASYDRPYDLNEHPTFGAPFVAPGKNVLDMSGGESRSDPRRTANGRWIADREFVWPDAPSANGGTVSLREFRAVPDGQVFTAIAADQSRPVSWFTIFNRDYPLLVGYVFQTADYPWISEWQNRPRADSDVGTARAVLFGTSPWDEGLRNSVERARLFGIPTYRFIGARQRQSTTFAVFLKEIPSGFAGVRDVRSIDGRYEVVERERQ